MDRPTSRTRMLLSAGGDGRFQWTPACGGLFSFEAATLRSSHPQHLHAWYCAYVVTAGTVTLWCRDDEWVATPGMVVLLSPYETHAEYFDHTVGCSFAGVYPTQSTVRASLGSAVAASSPFRFRRPVVRDLRLAALVLAAWRSLGEADRTEQARCVAQLVRALARHHVEESGASFEHRAVTLVRQYLHSRSGDLPSMTVMSQIAGLSRYHLSRVFRNAVGLSPYAYFEQVRLARARLLFHSGAAISRAAFAAGFSDQSHLTRQFGARVGTTPGEYARAVRAALESGGSMVTARPTSSRRIR